MKTAVGDDTRDDAGEHALAPPTNDYCGEGCGNADRIGVAGDRIWQKHQWSHETRKNRDRSIVQVAQGSFRRFAVTDKSEERKADQIGANTHDCDDRPDLAIGIAHRPRLCSISPPTTIAMKAAGSKPVPEGIPESASTAITEVTAAAR